MATIKDVAREAGVSIATVSCTLSGRKNVSYKTRIRVLAAIDKLEFVPNENARKLKLRTSREIGILLTSIDDLYHSEIFKGITSIIQGNNYSVIIGFSNNQPRTETEIINDFVSRDCAGIILISCLCNDTAYIARLLSHGIPTVFVERRPRKKDINFAGISNRKTIGFLVNNLTANGYRNISLFCGNPTISSESDCAAAFRESCLKNKRRLESAIHYTNMTKEDAFRVALEEFFNNPRPGALIATSENIARGILEAARVMGVSLEGSAIVAFSEETWMTTQYLPQLVHTSRPAFTLGETAASLLLRNISGEAKTGESVTLDDNILKTGVSMPRYSPPGKRSLSRNAPSRKPQELRLLLMDNHFTGGTLKILSRKFRNEYGIALSIDTDTQDELPRRIIEDAESNHPKYDIYMFDIPWLSFLAQNGFLEDITDVITSDRSFVNSTIRENLDNSLYQNRYYSVPYVGGAQILFYRTDLFEDPVISKDYFNEHGSKLRPPRTWPEFNAVARFFTRRFNRSSPVEFGTCCSGSMVAEFCPEIYSRIWGFGGRLFDRKNLPMFYSESSVMAFENLMELQGYVPSPLFSTSNIDAIREFYSGRTAMQVSYTAYASEITDAINRDIFGKVAFTGIPGMMPILTGWNLGINAFSKKKELACQLFKWLGRKDVNYYLTILDGQSTSIYPYENNELLRLYPWMRINIDNIKYAQKRIAGNKRKSLVIPWNRFEGIIYLNTRRMFSGQSIDTSLRAMNEEITELMKIYGQLA